MPVLAFVGRESDQTYQSRWSESFELRASLNHACYLERSGFVVMKKPPIGGGSARGEIKDTQTRANGRDKHARLSQVLRDLLTGAKGCSQRVGEGQKRKKPQEK